MVRRTWLRCLDVLTCLSRVGLTRIPALSYLNFRMSPSKSKIYLDSFTLSYLSTSKYWIKNLLIIIQNRTLSDSKCHDSQIFSNLDILSSTSIHSNSPTQHRTPLIPVLFIVIFIKPSLWDLYLILSQNFIAKIRWRQLVGRLLPL
jgi:hypothetical protein